MKGPTVVEDARVLQLFPEAVYHVPYMWMLLQHPSDAVARFVRCVQDGIGGPYVGIHERFESDVWALTKFRKSVETFYTRTLQRLSDALVLTHPNVKAWYATGGNTTRPADWGFRLKSEFIDVRLLSAPFIALPQQGDTWSRGRRMNVTNSTGALVDFLLVMGAAASLSARYSKFGSLLCAIRRRYLPGAPTYTYGTAFGLKSCTEKWSSSSSGFVVAKMPATMCSRGRAHQRTKKKTEDVVGGWGRLEDATSQARETARETALLDAVRAIEEGHGALSYHLAPTLLQLATLCGSLGETHHQMLYRERLVMVANWTMHLGMEYRRQGTAAMAGVYLARATTIYRQIAVRQST